MSKVASAEARVGMSRSEYFRTHSHLTHDEMAAELGVCRVSVINWMHELGLSTVVTRRIVKRRGVAA